MKKGAIFTVLLISSLLIAANSLDGFWGVNWGENKDTAIKIILSHKGVKLLKEQSTQNTILFKDGAFGGRSIDLLLLLFQHNQMCKARIIFDAPEQNVIYLYHEWQKDLKEKYGEPSDTFQYFKEPYYDGDGYETQAIKLGKARFVTVWEFPVKNNKPNNIWLEIDDTLKVAIEYENGELMSKYVAEKKDKERNDY